MNAGEGTFTNLFFALKLRKVLKNRKAIFGNLKIRRFSSKTLTKRKRKRDFVSQNPRLKSLDNEKVVFEPPDSLRDRISNPICIWVSILSPARLARLRYPRKMSGKVLVKKTLFKCYYWKFLFLLIMKRE